jgi:hypothetical protein
MPVKKRPLPVFLIVLSVLLFVITVSLFSMWGYQAVFYLLSQAFNVATESTIYDFFIGIVAMISSILVFVGTIRALQRRPESVKLMVLGTLGFFLKNVLDIIGDVQVLRNTVEVTEYVIRDAAIAIGGDLFQIAFWIFVFLYFKNSSLRADLS